MQSACVAVELAWVASRVWWGGVWAGGVAAAAGAAAGRDPAQALLDHHHLHTRAPHQHDKYETIPKAEGFQLALECLATETGENE
ncbi:hypothetical protein HF086_014451, partial [Spodoptera exigua]